MARTKKPVTHAICHPDRTAYAHGLCRPCYDSKRWTGKLPTTVSGEARRMAEEAAGTIPRADRKDFESSKYVRTENPAVANFVAGAIVQNFLDTERAVREIKPGLSPAQVAETAQKLERDPHVQREIQKTLEKRGLDEKSKEHYVDLLWRYAESVDPGDEKRQLQAMRILGRAFIGEKVEVDTPQALPIRGFDEGLRRMGLDDESLAGKFDGQPESSSTFDS
jgi:hypothetical protein